MGKLIKAFGEIIYDNKDTLQEYTEMTIDSFLEDGILKDIPLINTLMGVGKAVISVRDMHFIKKTLLFVEELKKDEVSIQRLAEHRKELEKDTRKAEKELETIIVYIDRCNESDKSKLLAKIYRAFYMKYIDWEEFKCYSSIIENLNLYDLELLREIYDKYLIKEDEHPSVGQVSRLSSLGLVQYFNGQVIRTGNGVTMRGRITGEGKKLCEIIFDNWEQ